MILDATTISHHQACKRRPILELDWLVRKHRAKRLFDALLVRAIHQISNAADPLAVADEARTRFLEAAANPGLDVPYGMNTYTIAKDWTAMLETILYAVGKMTLLKVKSAGTVSLSSQVEWKTASLVDDSSQLHRWVTVDRWNEEALAREMHGWHAFGDMAILRAPMMIHAIEIGQVRKGRRASPWARGWRNPHPQLRNIHGVHFKHKDGTSFTGWTPLYYADGEIDAEDWVAALARDQALQPLMTNVMLNAPSDQACNAAFEHILLSAAEIARAAVKRDIAAWDSFPMSRGSCDSLVPCPWQHACYSENIVDLSSTGMYIRRENLVPEKPQQAAK